MNQKVFLPLNRMSLNFFFYPVAIVRNYLVLGKIAKTGIAECRIFSTISLQCPVT